MKNETIGGLEEFFTLDVVYTGNLPDLRWHMFSEFQTEKETYHQKYLL